MTTTIELSLYPFQENFRERVRDFIKKLNDFKDLKITTGPTSTVIIGEHARVMDCLREMMEWSCANQGRSVFVAKFILDYDPS